MTVQFVDGHFVDSYYPTIENTFSKMIKWKNQDFATEIIDTAGQVRNDVSSTTGDLQSDDGNKETLGDAKLRAERTGSTQKASFCAVALTCDRC